MKILVIDPGTTKCGWGFFEYDGKNYSQIDWGIFETGKEINIGDRLAVLSTELKKIIQNKRPNVVAIEEIFFMKNIKTAISVAQARGVIISVCRINKLKVYEYKPTQIKLALTGYGHADKNQIQQMVKIILKLKNIPQPDDAADGLATAICFAHSEKF